MNRKRAALLLNAQLEFYRNMNRLQTLMRSRGNSLLSLARKVSGSPKSHRISPVRFRFVRVRRVKTKMTK